jgi:hypothetical protein
MKKITVIILLLCGTVYAQPSTRSLIAKSQLRNAITYRQDFINRQQNSEWMQQEYGNYEMYKYPWGLRKKTADRDRIEIDIRVLQFYEKYDMQLAHDENDGLITSNQRAKLNEEIMPIKLYEVLTKNKERVFPDSEGQCTH